MENKESDNKHQASKSPRGKYHEKLKVKGSFLDIIKASVKDANAKAVSKKKKKGEG